MAAMTGSVPVAPRAAGSLLGCRRVLERRSEVGRHGCLELVISIISAGTRMALRMRAHDDAIAYA